jgi:hypothetical protein
VLIDRSELHKGRPEKKLVEGLSKTGGRGGNGRIAVRFRGGGAKRLYRIVDFKRRKWDVPATVERMEYDPNRSAFIALIKYADGERRRPIRRHMPSGREEHEALGGGLRWCVGHFVHLPLRNLVLRELPTKFRELLRRAPARARLLRFSVSAVRRSAAVPVFVLDGPVGAAQQQLPDA